MAFYENVDENHLGHIDPVNVDKPEADKTTTPKILFLQPSMFAELFPVEHLTAGHIYKTFLRMFKNKELGQNSDDVLRFCLGLLHAGTADVKISHHFFDTDFYNWRREILYYYYGDPAKPISNNLIYNTFFHESSAV